MSVGVASRTAALARTFTVWRRPPLGMVALHGVVGLIVLFLIAPIVALIMISFTSTGYVTWPPVGFSLQWYSRIPAMNGIGSSVQLSLTLAAQTTAVSLLFGVAAALALARGAIPGRQVVLAGLMSPLVVPSIVTGLALLQFFFDRDLRQTSWNLLAGHVIISLPYVIRTVLASLEVFDWSLVDTARVLGANPWRAFWRVTLPIIRPGLLAGGIFAFLTSFDNYTISMFLADGEMVPLPVRLFNYVESMLEPSVAALSAALIFASALILIASDRLVGSDRLRGF